MCVAASDVAACSSDTQSEIEPLPDMRDPEQVDILLVDRRLPAVGEPGILDQELNLEVGQRAAVDRAWRAVDQVAGRPAAPQPGAVFHIVDDQRSRVQDFRKRQPILQLVEVAAHHLAADRQRISAPALAAPAQYVDQRLRQVLHRRDDGGRKAKRAGFRVAQQAGRYQRALAGSLEKALDGLKGPAVRLAEKGLGMKPGYALFCNPTPAPAPWNVRRIGLRSGKSGLVQAGGPTKLAGYHSDQNPRSVLRFSRQAKGRIGGWRSRARSAI